MNPIFLPRSAWIVKQTRRKVTPNKLISYLKITMLSQLNSLPILAFSIPVTSAVAASVSPEFALGWERAGIAAIGIASTVVMFTLWTRTTKRLEKERQEAARVLEAERVESIRLRDAEYARITILQEAERVKREERYERDRIARDAIAKRQTDIYERERAQRDKERQQLLEKLLEKQGLVLPREMISPGDVAESKKPQTNES